MADRVSAGQAEQARSKLWSFVNGGEPAALTVSESLALLRALRDIPERLSSSEREKTTIARESAALNAEEARQLESKVQKLTDERDAMERVLREVRERFEQGRRTPGAIMGECANDMYEIVQAGLPGDGQGQRRRKPMAGPAHTWRTRDPLSPLRGYLDGNNEEHVMTLVEDPSFIDYFRRLLRAYDAHTEALISISQLGPDESDRATAEAALNHVRAILGGAA